MNVYQFWPFKPSAGNAPTMPSAALQVHALTVQEKWMEVLDRAGIERIITDAEAAINRTVALTRSAV